jgi:hypothetical protein
VVSLRARFYFIGWGFEFAVGTGNRTIKGGLPPFARSGFDVYL